MRTEGNHNHNVGPSAGLTSLLVDAAPPRTSRPPSPLDIAIENGSDDADWVSYPLFYPHVVRLLSDGADIAYGMRMRGADGHLTLLYGPDGDLENVRRHVELRWLHFLDACLTPPQYGDEEQAAELYRHLARRRKLICPESPPGARSPFEAVDLSEIDEADLHNYPVGFPFVVNSTDKHDPYPTTAMIRAVNLKFESFAKVTGFHGPGQEVILWNLVLEIPDFDREIPASIEAVTAYHVAHCEKRGIKSATYPSCELPVAAFY